MDNYTTFETSVKLKEKGFPQPDLNPGQFWYEEDGALFVVQQTRDNGHILSSYINASGHLIGASDDSDVYAATPGDILKELGKDYNLSFFEGLFYCVYDNLMGKAYSHENPAEACALAYLDK